MKVAAVQFKARKGRLDESLRALVRLASAAGEGADLVVLPEMAVTGYVFPDRAAVAAVAEGADGPTARALGDVARAASCWVVCGFPELAGDRVYNAALVLDPSGSVAFTYRKTLLYRADLPWATPGDSGYRRFDTDAGSFGVGICMDLNDDRFVDWCASEDLDAVALPTNWIDEGEPVWPYWAWRMAPVDGALVAANTYGVEGLGADATRFSGMSAVIRRGRVLSAAPPAGDGILSASLSV